MTLLVTPRAPEAAALEADRLSTSADFYTAIGAATLPGIHAIARELAEGRAARGERRLRVDDLTPASCDDPV